MSEVLLAIETGGLFFGTLAVSIWFAKRSRDHGAGGDAVRAAIAAHDEIWHAAAHRTHFVVQTQEQQMVAKKTPDDKLTPGRDKA